MYLANYVYPTVQSIDSHDCINVRTCVNHYCTFPQPTFAIYNVQRSSALAKFSTTAKMQMRSTLKPQNDVVGRSVVRRNSVAGTNKGTNERSFVRCAPLSLLRRHRHRRRRRRHCRRRRRHCCRRRRHCRRRYRRRYRRRR